MRLLSLFTGVGAWEMALRGLGVPIELLNFSEIYEPAVCVYTTLFGEPRSKNLGDITKVGSISGGIDLMTYSFPCQDISIAGKKEGLVRRSGLLWNVMSLVESLSLEERPKMMIAENVKNLVQGFRDDYTKWLNYMSDLGYDTTYFILNASNLGGVQPRERVFVISIKRPYTLSMDVSKLYKTYPYKTLRDILLDSPQDPKLYLKKGYHSVEPTTGDHIRVSYRRDNYVFNSTGTIYDIKGHSPTLVRKPFYYMFSDGSVRYLTPLELWRVQGFSDDDFNKLKPLGLSSFKFLQLTGNSIELNMLRVLLGAINFSCIER
jgi:DNA (cytosine-5)-methyltransferase 1